MSGRRTEDQNQPPAAATDPQAPGRGPFTLARVGLILGPVLFVIFLFLPIPGLTTPAQGVLGLAVWMAIWWFSEPIPIAATSLLPLVVYPLLGPAELNGVERSYADSVILLFLGTLLLARGISRSGIDERVALHLLNLLGGSPKRLVIGFMVACAALSAWISATATTVIMLPIALAVIATVRDEEQRRQLGKCLVLGVVYGSTLGVLSTIIATPPNAVFATIAPDLLGFEVGFGQWMLVGVPMTVVSVVLCWLYLVYWVAPIHYVSLVEGNKVVAERLIERGPMTRDERMVGAVFVLTVVAWVSRSLVWGELLPNVSNMTISLAGATALFLLPSEKGGRLLDWETAVKLPWSVLLLIAGGLALAYGFTALGIDVWIANRLGFLEALPAVLAVAVMATITIFVGEVMSNAATAALLIPIAAPLAVVLGVSPLQLTLAVTLAASFGFTLPVATPSNAVALSTGQITTSQLARAGLPMNLLGVILVTLAVFTLVPLVFN
ncbi:MAG: DASS family sodium-coupled anion symporter [Candidatus Promineofilum sp.]|nr:DASS family sodium-coupled anion symporter [Promineifilum sp.]